MVMKKEDLTQPIQPHVKWVNTYNELNVTGETEREKESEREIKRERETNTHTDRQTEKCRDNTQRD